MKIVDELMTPGCPQCAVKHLSAALSYSAEAFAMAKRYGVPDLSRQEPKVLLARAYINLGEVLIGYESHLWFAVGLLQRAEEEALCLDAPRGYSEKAREARLLLEKDGLAGVRRAMQAIGGGVLFGPADMAAAHLEEARRELPADDGYDTDYAGAIERIRKEYFNLPAGTVPVGEETTQTEKEPDMATAKKAVSKKGAKCAAKGGKTATKACDKGGKAKK